MRHHRARQTRRRTEARDSTWEMRRGATVVPRRAGGEVRAARRHMHPEAGLDGSLQHRRPPCERQVCDDPQRRCRSHCLSGVAWPS
eukprot:6405303-Prymnesium_polylepis.1